VQQVHNKILLIEDKKFYTYVYLDQRKLGYYSYNEGRDIFNYEPIYVGKGVGNRMYDHWNYVKRKCDNNKKLNKVTPFLSKLKSLYNKRHNPIIIKVLENVNEQEAFDEEIRLIWVIGRNDLNMGPLLNRTWGGEGVSGAIWSDERRKVQSNRMKEENSAFSGNPWNKDIIHTEEYKNEIYRSIDGNCSGPNINKKKSSQKRWENPEEREKTSRGVKKFYQTEEGKQKAKEIGRKNGERQKGTKRGPNKNKIKYTDKEKDIKYASRSGKNHWRNKNKK